ncbi:hypothetical protein ATE80_01965 [Streptomyces kanasensis]|uniref:Uncharacterized protein n=1 Tax=Streptomyces kanasensis TaxID=936756 RepID=A0A117IXC1_9ACTN|nr:hypothetical protein ATE80_01965 [Streptomyces kanasensis]
MLHDDRGPAVLHAGEGLPALPVRVRVREPLTAGLVTSWPEAGRHDAGGGLAPFSPARPR